jgi:hypothetical protein
MDISPVPSDEEAAAIAAALQVVSSQVVVDSAAAAAPPRWRFAGRWWSKPIPIRRDRPW